MPDYCVYTLQFSPTSVQITYTIGAADSASFPSVGYTLLDPACSFVTVYTLEMQSGPSDPLPSFITSFDGDTRTANFFSNAAGHANIYDLVMKVVEPKSGATSSLQIELTVNLPPYCVDVLAFTNPTVAYTF